MQTQMPANIGIREAGAKEERRRFNRSSCHHNQRRMHHYRLPYTGSLIQRPALNARNSPCLDQDPVHLAAHYKARTLLTGIMQESQ